MKTMLLLLAGLFATQGGWWDPGWAFRRKIAIKNNLEGDLKPGHPVEIEIDLAYLGMEQKAKKDFADLAVVHEGKRIPCAILPGRSPACRTVAFRTAAGLRAGGVDAGYSLYYGNAEAAPEPDARAAVFDFFEDFSDAGSVARKFAVDKDLAASVQDGALVLRDVAVGRTENTPARVVFKEVPSTPGFSLSFDVEIESAVASAPGFAVTIDLKEPGTDDQAVAKKADELIEKLGDLEWESRENATKELIRLGRVAVAKLVEATRSADAEVKWRSEHILKEIREHSPSPTISAGLMAGDTKVGPVALTSTIGKTRGRVRYGGSWPAHLRMTVLRDPDGDVAVLWNSGQQKGHLPGEVREIAFTVWKGSAAPLGVIRVRNVVLKRHVDDDLKPTYTLEVEEKRP
jgi:hypothetical protein